MSCLEIPLTFKCELSSAPSGIGANQHSQNHFTTLQKSDLEFHKPLSALQILKSQSIAKYDLRIHLQIYLNYIQQPASCTPWKNYKYINKKVYNVRKASNTVRLASNHHLFTLHQSHCETSACLRDLLQHYHSWCTSTVIAITQIDSAQSVDHLYSDLNVGSALTITMNFSRN